ncbi:coiled-coil domain-containing protein [Candidatus Enterovibrio escicola]|uniref:hypothetical protein n=1 Tax=Candidatus Enterovibrio escicola TaxID=1927127 RepID=UPI001681959C|nr:hypothetical protein [Candidatus Enterovibrio escacola]
MKLTRVELTGSYKGLHDSVFDFSKSNSFLLAFIGLNGCGKSQLLELIDVITSSMLSRFSKLC